MTTTLTQKNGKEEAIASHDAWPLIHAYTRADAIADGVLIPVDEKLARDAGFKIPVALTQAVHERYVRVPQGVHDQDETERLWDILIMSSYAFLTERSRDPVSTVELVVRDGNRAPQYVRLKACFGQGDEPGKTVLTIMLPTES